MEAIAVAEAVFRDTWIAALHNPRKRTLLEMSPLAYKVHLLMKRQVSVRFGADTLVDTPDKTEVLMLAVSMVCNG